MIRFVMIITMMVFAAPVMAKEYRASSSQSSACAVAQAYVMPPGVAVDNAFNLNLDVVRFPVTVDLVQAFGLVVPVGTELEPQFGMIEVHPDGRILYNEHNISSRVEEVCK